MVSQKSQGDFPHGKVAMSMYLYIAICYRPLDLSDHQDRKVYACQLQRDK